MTTSEDDPSILVSGGLEFPEISKFDPWKSILEAKKETVEKMCHKSQRDCELRERLEKAELQIAKNEAEIHSLRNQMESYMSFGLNIGATMGNLVWRASYEPDVINSWFSKQSSCDQVAELVQIADEIIGTFFSTYEDACPDCNCDVYKFTRGLLGTVANISVTPEGRQFLIDDKNGQNLLKNLVLHMPKLPKPTGDRLKRDIMIILSNICINASAMRYLFDLNVGPTIAHCLEESNAQTLGLLGLEFLFMITYNVTDSKLLQKLEKYAPLENIKHIAALGNEKAGSLAQKILKSFDELKNPSVRS